MSVQILEDKLKAIRNYPAKCGQNQGKGQVSPVYLICNSELSLQNVTGLYTLKYCLNFNTAQKQTDPNNSVQCFSGFYHTSDEDLVVSASKLKLTLELTHDLFERIYPLK